MSRLQGKSTNFIEVGEEGHLFTRGANEDVAQYMSDEHGLAFSWQSTTWDYAAADTILSVTNDSTHDLVVTEIHVYGDTATTFQVHMPDMTGITPTGTSITGVAVNTRSGEAAADYCTAIRDETGQATQGNVIINSYIAANGTKEIKFDGSARPRIKKNFAIAVDFTTDGTAALATIFGYIDKGNLDA